MEYLEDIGVVPYIGTWIETLMMAKYRYGLYVVPYIGTWIETLIFWWIYF